MSQGSRLETDLEVLSSRFEQALTLHRAGQLEPAQAIYEKILERHPVHPGALNLLGAIALQTGNLQRAAQLFDRAVAADPNDVVACCNRAGALWRLRELDAALASYDRAIALKNDLAEAHFNRGDVLRELGRLQPALLSYQRVVAIEPDHAEAHLRCGDALRDLRHCDAALESYSRALNLVPDFEEALFGRGTVFESQRQWEAALASYNQAIAIKSDYVRAHFHCANVLVRLKKWDTALASYDQVIAFDPGSAEGYCNRAIVLKQLKRLDEALASFDRAIALRPDYAEAHCNRGNALKEMMRLDAALTSFDRAIILRPGFAEARFNRALVRLLQGDLEKGWVDYEWRWKGGNDVLNGGVERVFLQPLWRGEPLNGKAILLYGEQGLGDTLQFCRYVEQVAGLGAHVVLEVPRPLQSLLARLQSASLTVATGQGLPQIDYQCPLLSLPLRFDTSLSTIPASTRYLLSDPVKVSRWRARLGGKRIPRVGLVWSGSALHKHDDERSVVLEQLVRYLPVGPQYVSLQQEVRESDRGTLEAHPQILRWGEELHDFCDTAALCECLDVVISVDTSVAHLSGALGKDTWILLPFVPDWRWLLDRQDSPWYPTVRLYRQDKWGHWDAVLEHVRSGLIEAFQ